MAVLHQTGPEDALAFVARAQQIVTDRVVLPEGVVRVRAGFSTFPGQDDVGDNGQGLVWAAARNLHEGRTEQAN